LEVCFASSGNIDNFSLEKFLLVILPAGLTTPGYDYCGNPCWNVFPQIMNVDEGCVDYEGWQVGD
jgi:hypothetical protein